MPTQRSVDVVAVEFDWRGDYFPSDKKMSWEEVRFLASITFFQLID